MSNPVRVSVVGSINADLTVRTPRLPRTGETLLGHSLQLGCGGKGANQAVAAARLGAGVSLIGCVGDDLFGHDSLRQCRAESIDISFIRVAHGQATGFAAIVVDDNADNCIIVVPGANARLSRADVEKAAPTIQRAQVLLCQLEVPVDTTLEAFRVAKAVGVRTILTPAPAATLPNELLDLTDVCIPNQTELELLTGRQVASVEEVQMAARQLWQRGPHAVIVTLGKRGALLFDAAGPIGISPVKVDAIDPTGAGDAFAAAVAVFWAEGMALAEAAQRATAVAALSVTRPGTQTAFPTRTELETFHAARS